MLTLKIFFILGVKSVQKHAKILSGFFGQIVVNIDDGIKKEFNFGF
jgi:hypothetical protein